VKIRAAHRRNKLFGLLRAFRDAAVALPDAMVAVDENQKIAWFNTAAGSLLGLHHPVDLGKPVATAIDIPGLVEWIDAGGIDPLCDVTAPADADVHLNVRLIP
jgi:two-component system phosphate regulon sensor histidine kinase PhoR